MPNLILSSFNSFAKKKTSKSSCFYFFSVLWLPKSISILISNFVGFGLDCGVHACYRRGGGGGGGRVGYNLKSI